MSSEKVIHKTSIGGQAVLEGIMMKGPKKTCIAVRKPDGEIAMEQKETTHLKDKYAIAGVPIIRGFINMICMLIEGLQAIEYSSKFFDDDEDASEPGKIEKWLDSHVSQQKLENILYSFSMVLGVAIAVGLFVILPAVIIDFLPAQMPHFAQNLIEGIVRIALFILYMWAVSLMKDIKRTYEYHGAEHKTIFCYEKGLPLTVENVRVQGRFHPRCGTSFLFVIMIVSILVFSIISVKGKILRVVLRIVLLPLVIGLSYEVIKITGRHDNILSRIVSWPGRMLQHLTVLEPDDSMIEVAIAAMTAVIPEDKSEDAW